MKNRSFIVSAVITAVLSTACCLPAFLFLFLGISVGSLSFLTQVDFLRIPFGILSVVFFIIFIFTRKQKMKCECENKRFKTYSSIVLFGLGLIVLLFYPEFAVYFVE